MSSVNSLDKIIRELDPKDKLIRELDSKSKTKLLDDKKLVIIDRKKWQAVAGKSILNNLFGSDLAYYLVCNATDLSNVAERRAKPYYLTYFPTGQKVGISITYWASCEAGYEEKAVESLCRSKSISEALDQQIEKWIADHTKNNASVLLENYFIKLREIQENVKIKIKEETGVNLELKLELEKEAQLEPFSIPSFPIDVYVSDYDDKLELQIETELIIDENNKIKAILNDVNDSLKWQGLIKLIKNEIKSYIRQNITVNQFSYELKDVVRQALFDHLNTCLNEYGRQVGYLKLNTDANASAKQLVSIKSKVECEVQKYSDSIFVENTILMLPLRTAIYKSNESSKLEAWVESQLETIIKPLMLENKYIDILLNFDKIAKTIESNMTKAAKAIGYELKQIVTVPELEHYILKEDFDLKLEKKSFQTNDANVKVDLSISATIKIQDFIKIQDYLKPKTDIRRLIEEAISRTTEQYLGTISPARYYMHFFYPGIDENGEQEKKSVQEELIEAIKTELVNRFGAEVSRVTADVHDTEIAKHFKKLQGEIGLFEVVISSLNGIEESVTYKGDFQVVDVEKNSWYKFQSKHPDIDAIRASIVRGLNAKLATFSKDDLQYSDLEYLHLIEGLINKFAGENVVNQFGIVISITNLCRERTYQESALSAERKFEQDEYQKVRLEEIRARAEIAAEMRRFNLAELLALKQERLKIITEEDNEEELEELDKKIRIIEGKALTSSMQDEARKTIKTPISKTPSLRELAEKVKLQEVQNNDSILDSTNRSNTPQIEDS